MSLAYENRACAEKSFREHILPEIEPNFTKRNIGYKWKYNGTMDEYSHHQTERVEGWHLPNGGHIGVCIRATSRKDTLDGATVIACCKFLADTKKEKVLVLLRIDGAYQWRILK